MVIRTFDMKDLAGPCNGEKQNERFEQVSKTGEVRGHLDWILIQRKERNSDNRRSVQE